MVVAGPVGWECDSKATGQLRMGPLWMLALLGHSCSDILSMDNVGTGERHR